MHRRLFLGSIIGLALQSAAAKAQSQQPSNPPFDPVPALVHVKMIVVDHVGVISEDRSLLVQLDARPFGVEVAKFMASRFDAAGHPVICVDLSQLRTLPERLPDADILHVRFRFDLSSVRVADDPAALVGTVSTYYQREEFSLLSWVPMTHFVVEGDRSALAKRAEQALMDQAQNSVVYELVYLKERGF